MSDILCGIDEAGRGPIAGDLVVAGCIFHSDTNIDGLNDSKKISEKDSVLLYKALIQFTLNTKSFPTFQEILLYVNGWGVSTVTSLGEVVMISGSNSVFNVPKVPNVTKDTLSMANCIMTCKLSNKTLYFV